MRGHRHGWLVWLAGLTLTGSSGCLAHVHPVSGLPAELAEHHEWVLPEQQQHVHVFMINGIDPLHYGNLIGVCEHLRCLGYYHSYYGQLYHTHCFTKEMRRVFAEDCQARFVVVGYSMGAPAAYAMAQDARAEGLPLDLVIFIAGKGVKYLHDREPDRPIRVIDIQACNWIWKGEFAEPADRVNEPEVGHFQAPTDYRTLDTLAKELAMVSARVPAEFTVGQGSQQELDLSEMLKPVSSLAPGRLNTAVRHVAAKRY